MMVPRAYHYATPPQDLIHDEKEQARETMRPKLEAKKEMDTTEVRKPLRMLSAPPATPSRPVVIPTRTQSPRLRSRGGEAVELAQRRKYNNVHDSNAMPPSMAALLAVTSLPSPRGSTSRKKDTKPRFALSSVRSLEGTSPDDFRHSLSSSSPKSWDLLQSPPDEIESDMWSIGSDSTVAPLSSFRSLSSDSMPSLDIDLDSPQSSGDPFTPEMRLPRRERREKKFISFSLPEDCGLDHPLSPLLNDIIVDEPTHTHASDVEILSPNVSMPITPTRSSFKSNLTASIRALKSAARSLASIPIPESDFLPPSNLSIALPYTQERRPNLSEDLPDPAMRRYLNPIAISPTDLYFHQHYHTPRDRITASIQLQPYQRPLSCSKNATSPPIFIPSARSAFESQIMVNEQLPDVPLAMRQREPRENSDFLRVIVLEMSMRRSGKLGDDAIGRARIWLPPREEPGKRQGAICEREEEGRVPRRWRGVGVST